MHQTDTILSDNRRAWLLAFGIISATTLIRLWFVATVQLNLVQDEAQYWDWSRRLQLSYYSKGPLIAYIIRFWTEVFGNNELGVRFGAVLGSFLTQCVLWYGLARLMDRPKAGLWGLVIYNSLPLFCLMGLVMTTDNPLLLFWTCSIFCLYAGSRPKSDGRAPTLPFVLLALCLALGYLAKYMMAAFIPLALVHILLLRAKGLAPKGYGSKLASAILAGLFLGVLPTLIWNMQNDWVGFKHVSHLVGVSGKKAKAFFQLHRFPEFLLSQIGVAMPWWIFYMVAGTFAGIGLFRKGNIMSSMPENHSEIRRYLVGVSTFLPLAVFYLLWGMHTKMYANWTLVLWVGGTVLAALHLSDEERASKNRPSRLWIGLATFIFLALHSLQFLPASINPIKSDAPPFAWINDKVVDTLNTVDPYQRLKGWDDLGRVIDEHRNREFNNPERVFFFSDVYDITSALGFYIPGQPHTYCAWTHHRRMNQYDLWPGPQDKKGWDAIYVRKRFKGSVDFDPETMFQSVSDPIHVQTVFNGKPARKFTIYLCRGFNGKWESLADGEF